MEFGLYSDQIWKDIQAIEWISSKLSLSGPLKQNDMQLTSNVFNEDQQLCY